MTTIVPRQPGLDALPPYAPGTPAAAPQHVLGCGEILHLDSNENPLGPSPKVVAALAAALPNLNRYPDADASALRGPSPGSSRSGPTRCGWATARTA